MSELRGGHQTHHCLQSQSAGNEWYQLAIGSNAESVDDNCGQDTSHHRDSAGYEGRGAERMGHGTHQLAVRAGHILGLDTGIADSQLDLDWQKTQLIISENHRILDSYKYQNVILFCYVNIMKCTHN